MYMRADGSSWPGQLRARRRMARPCGGRKAPHGHAVCGLRRPAYAGRHQTISIGHP